MGKLVETVRDYLGNKSGKIENLSKFLAHQMGLTQEAARRVVIDLIYEEVLVPSDMWDTVKLA